MAFDRDKFRGKRIDSGEWIYWNLIYSSDACKEYETLIIPQKNADGFTTDYASNGENKESYGFDNWFCVIPETVGQYTGLKDKNGKEIYEGDIIKSLCQVFSEDDQDALISEVYYHESYAAFYLLASNRDCENDDYEIDEPLEQFIHNYDILEVIGNIHENPELLEVV